MVFAGNYSCSEMAVCATADALDLVIMISMGYDGSAYYDDDDYCYYLASQDSASGDEVEPLLFVSGTGEETRIRYRAIAFDVTWNRETDSFSFPPDPQGAQIDPSIQCALILDEETVIGSCYREDRSCDFRFEREDEDSPSDEAVYRLAATNCLLHEERGPFLVP